MAKSMIARMREGGGPDAVTVHDLGLIEHPVNLKKKAPGVMVWLRDLGKPAFASGPEPGDAWVDAMGAVVATPAAV